MLKPTNTAKGAIDYNTDLTDLDSMIERLGTPKQDMPGFSQPKPEPVKEPAIFDPVFQSENKEPRQHDPEKNRKQGLRIAKTIDKLVATGAMKIAHGEDMKRYQATQSEITDLGEAWGEYTEEKDINLPPWLSLLFINLTVYAPNVFLALNDKRIYEQQNQINDHSDQIQTLQDQIKKMKDEQEKP